MSIEAAYRRITPQEFARLQCDARAAESFFGRGLEDLDNPEKYLARRLEQEAGGRFLGIGNEWHALHFLLTGDAELKPHPLPPPPLGNVVSGGTETEWDCTYGKVRSLNPEEVRAVAGALSQISAEDLRTRFSAASLNSARIYPHGRRGSWTDEDAKPISETYARVVEFFKSAAREGDMMLLSAD